jgi:SAM-dependent methyltransferase
MQRLNFHATQCAICRTADNCTELYPSTFDEQSFNTAVFSARRLPDRIHYRLVKCNKCGLVRSDPVCDFEAVLQLYRESVFTYEAETDNLAATYGRYLRLAARGGGSRSLLEIGSGNGFFLREALRQGFADVVGVEPSSDAIEHADPEVRERLVCDVMRPNLFAAERFDVVCLFQVFDHIPAPRQLVEDCYHVLKSGGRILFLNHNVTSFSARLLGQKSPIIDIEHTYLYSLDTLARFAVECGFRVSTKGSVWNTYSPHYLVRLLPLPGGLKSGLLKLLARPLFQRIRLRVPLGNLYLIAEKPGAKDVV